jgi:hypothetical protein
MTARSLFDDERDRKELERQRAEYKRVGRMSVYTSRALLEIGRLHDACPPECPTQQLVNRYFTNVHLVANGKSDANR